MTTFTPQTSAASAGPGVDPEGDQVWGLMAEFESPAQIMHAAEQVRDAGYKFWDCHTPFPVHGLDGAMGIKPTILPILVFFGGLTGTIVAFILQWFTNASAFDVWAGVPVRGYDFLISGKPMMSVPAWIPVIFELTVLLSATGCVGWLLLLNWLPAWYHPVFKSERFARVTDDRFFLTIERRDPQFRKSETESLLASMNPLSLETLEK